MITKIFDPESKMCMKKEKGIYKRNTYLKAKNSRNPTNPLQTVSINYIHISLSSDMDMVNTPKH